MHRIVVKSGMVAVLSAAASVVVAVTVVNATGGTFDRGGLLMSVVCPLLIAWPASAYQMWQNRRIAEAHAALKQAHADLAVAHRRLAERASRDPMTGMLNRESFFDAVKARRATGRAGALLIIDADRFKAINDTHGHQTGDRALIEIGAAILRSAWHASVIGRIGGEEFAVFVPCEDSAPNAERAAERIREEVAAIAFFAPDGEHLPLSVSIGGATLMPDQPLARTMRLADQRLYMAKRAGRNRCVVSDAGDRAAA